MPERSFRINSMSYTDSTGMIHITITSANDALISRDADRPVSIGREVDVCQDFLLRWLLLPLLCLLIGHEQFGRRGHDGSRRAGYTSQLVAAVRPLEVFVPHAGPLTLVAEVELLIELFVPEKRNSFNEGPVTCCRLNCADKFA